MGAPAELRRIWFARVLRDGFALTAAGATGPSAVLAREGPRARCSATSTWTAIRMPRSTM